MPSPHVPFDHELWRLIEEQLSLGNYSAQQVTEWYAENERWAHLQADPSSQSPFRQPIPPPSPMDDVLPIIPASTFDLARISQDLFTSNFAPALDADNNGPGAIEEPPRVDSSQFVQMP